MEAGSHCHPVRCVRTRSLQGELQPSNGVGSSGTGGTRSLLSHVLSLPRSPHGAGHTARSLSVPSLTSEVVKQSCSALCVRPVWPPPGQRRGGQAFAKETVAPLVIRPSQKRVTSSLTQRKPALTASKWASQQGFKKALHAAHGGGGVIGDVRAPARQSGGGFRWDVK